MGATQVSETEADEVTPVPLRLTVAAGLLDEVLLTLSCPVTAPVAVGSN